MTNDAKADLALKDQQSEIAIWVTSSWNEPAIQTVLVTDW